MSSSEAVQHGSFVIERVYSATPARVFGAWATSEAKRHWFHGGTGWTQLEHSLDFRVGGLEISRGHIANGVRHDYDAHYQSLEGKTPPGMSDIPQPSSVRPEVSKGCAGLRYLSPNGGEVRQLNFVANQETA